MELLTLGVKTKPKATYTIVANFVAVAIFDAFFVANAHNRHEFRREFLSRIRAKKSDATKIVTPVHNRRDFCHFAAIFVAIFVAQFQREFASKKASLFLTRIFDFIVNKVTRKA